MQIGNPLYPDEQKRLISASVAGVRLVCAYVPNGQSVDSDKYRYKLDWIDALLRWLEPQTGEGHEPLALLGDFNIAPEERDVHDPKLWEGQVLFSEPERERFRALQRLGLVDAFRLFDQPEKSYTWWDYRQMAFRRNSGTSHRPHHGHAVDCASGSPPARSTARCASSSSPPITHR